MGVFLWLFSLFLFFMNAEEYIAGGPTSLIKGAVFSSQLCVFMAEPLLLKCNHSNLLLWFPIERISSSLSQIEKSGFLQLGFGVSHLMPLPW